MSTGKTTRRAFVTSALAGVVVLPRIGLAQDSGVEGGIGGTGIVGVLTDFGSLIVAGHRVETDGSTRVSDAFGARDLNDLAIGDSLTVEAATVGGAFLARRVHVTHPLAGEIQSASSDGRRLRINGVEVQLERPDPLAREGGRVLVNGIWNGDRVVASRLAPAGGGGDLISGSVSRRNGTRHIGPVPLEGGDAQGLAEGSYAEVLGQTQRGGGFVARAVNPARFTGAAGPLVALSIEGYLEPQAARPGFRISGLGHSFERGLDVAPLAGHRFVIDGAYTGRFAAERAVILPEAFAARRAVLRDFDR